MGAKKEASAIRRASSVITPMYTIFGVKDNNAL